MPEWKNWSGWVKAAPEEIVTPSNEDALAYALANAPGRVRVVGTGHSFTALAATDGTLIDPSSLAGLISVNGDKTEAIVWAGTPLHELTRALHAAGAALANQGDIDRQTIAGAISTGTHGTGGTLGAFPTMVTALRLVTPSGEIIEASATKNADVFEAGRLSMGALGVISQVTLKVQPAYKLKEQGWTMPSHQCLKVLDELTSATRHFEFFWFPFAEDVICKSLEVTNEDALPLRKEGQSSRSIAEERRVRRMFDLAARLPFLTAPVTRFMTHAAGSGSMERHAKSDTHVRWSHEAFPSPRNIRFNEMEWALPVDAGADAIREIVAYVRQKSVRVAFPIEFRTVAADDVWLSPFNGRASVTIAVHQYHKQPYKEFFDCCETIFRAYEGRPHWGKLHRCTEADFYEMYPDWEKFQAVRKRLDPGGRMLNTHLETIFGEGEPSAG